MIRKARSPFAPPALDVLESRVLLNSTPALIAAALDLPALDLPPPTAPVYVGQPEQVQDRASYGVNGFFGFPTGADNDFLILSTGYAAWADTFSRTAAGPGRDLGVSDDAGAAGDDDAASIDFTLPVPAGAQRLKIDFMYLAQMPAYVDPETYEEELYADVFSVKINGVECAIDTADVPDEIDVNNAAFVYDDTRDMGGTYFDGRTPIMTATYVLPPGLLNARVVISLKDKGDGLYDTVALLDNVRFETTQTVWVNFGGQDVADHFGWGSQTFIPAFETSDIRALGTRDDTIASILTDLRANFADYGIVFTAGDVPPAQGQYTRLVVGGWGQTITHLNPLVQALEGLPANATLDDFTVAGLLGQADDIDVGNVVADNLVVVLAGETRNYGDPSQTHLVNVMAHELGHALGLRHVVVSNDADIMKKFNTLTEDLQFSDSEMTLYETWADGQTVQNDHQYLLGVLGAAGATAFSGATGSLRHGEMMHSLTLSFVNKLYNVTIGEAGLNHVHLDVLDGPTLVTFPIYMESHKLFFSASSKPGGPIDIVSGTPDATGLLTPQTSMVSLYNGTQMISGFNVSQLYANGKFQMIAHRRQAAVKPVPVSLVGSEYARVPLAGSTSLAWAKGAKAALTDNDGDVYTVTLKGGGTLAVVQDDPDGDGRGPIQQLLLGGTTSASRLSVTVRRAKDAAGLFTSDGIVGIGEIHGPALGSLSAKPSDLDGKGIWIDGLLGKVVLRDLAPLSTISAGGLPADHSSLTVREIGDQAQLQFVSTLTQFTANQVGEADIQANGIGRLNVAANAKAFLPGDFAAKVRLEGTGLKKALGTARIAGDMTGADWEIVAGNVGTFSVLGTCQYSRIAAAGNVSSLVFAQLLNSNVYVGLSPAFSAFGYAGSGDALPGRLTDFDDASLGSVKITGLKALPGVASFAGSNIAARRIGTVSAGVATTNNLGVKFGIAADSINRLSIQQPASSFRSLKDPEVKQDQDLVIVVL